MPTSRNFPKFRACVRLYHNAYREHGTDQFSRDQLETDGVETDVSHLLELSVAYGLIVSEDGSYRIDVEPDTGGDRWRSALEEHARRVKQAIDEVDMGWKDPEISDDEVDSIVHESKTFGSVRVSDGESFGSVADSVRAVVSDDWDGIVLRSPGEYANEVQRFADRLCRASERPETGAVDGFRKDSSDVVGSDKDELEFRLFLLYA